MRITDFWERMDLTFGPTYSRSWAEDQHLATLGGLTVAQALALGIATREVWAAVCAHSEVSGELR
jgi:hypothetical protein